jgi:hypothetical protein
MKILVLEPNQIITLNDYPLHSNEVLKQYYARSEAGDNLPLVPVLRKRDVKEGLDDKLLGVFRTFEREHPEAEYFMLDGSHRTTALTLSKRKIRVIVYENDGDILEAKSLVRTGQILNNDTLNHTLKENCSILYRHFEEKPYFMTVEQKTRKVKDDLSGNGLLK